MIKVIKKIGTAVLEYEGTDLKNCLEWLGQFANTPDKCDVCSKAVELSHKTTTRKSDGQKFKYCLIKCTDSECGAEGSFGETKEGNRLYWKWDTKMKRFQSQNPPGVSIEQSQDAVGANLPF